MRAILASVFKLPSRDGLYALLFVFTVVSVLPGAYGNRIMGGAVWLATAGLLAWRLEKRRREASLSPVALWRDWRGRHPLDAACWVLLATGLALSVGINAFRVEQILGGVLMVSALACYAFLFSSYFLFRRLEDDSGYLWALALMVAVHGIPVWEMVHYDSAAALLQYTVGKTTLKLNRISSVFPNVTTYAPFAAVVAVYCYSRAFAGTTRGKSRYVEWAVAVLATAGALVAGSRTGILALFVGLLVLFWRLEVRKKLLVAAVALAALVALNLFALRFTYLGKKVGLVFPYVAKLKNDKPLEAKDFVPDLTLGRSGKKGSRWSRIQQALGFWKERPLLGIGLGQYNMRSGLDWFGNVHNVPANILVEAGLLVFVPLAILAARFLWRWRGTCMAPVIVTVFTVSMFENLFDHSMAWVLTCSWMFAREGPS